MPEAAAIPWIFVDCDLILDQLEEMLLRVWRLGVVLQKLHTGARDAQIKCSMEHGVCARMYGILSMVPSPVGHVQGDVKGVPR